MALRFERCFTMALAFGLQADGYTPTELTTEAAVTGAGRQRLESIAEAQFV